MAFVWNVWVFHMPMMLDLMWQVSFCHGDTGLLGNVLSYLFVDLAAKYAISCPCKNSTVVFEVLLTSILQQLFLNLISIVLRGNSESNGFTYATPFLVIVCLGVNEVLFGCNVNDTTPVFPGSTHTLFLTVSGTEIC